MKITINFQSKTTLDVEPSERIKTVKDKIYKQKNIRPDHQRLLFAGVELEDAKTISNYGIIEDSRIDLIPLYTKVTVPQNATPIVKDFIDFHSNCEEWMTESLVSNGSLIEERDKWKQFSYNLTSEIVQIKKQNKLFEVEMQDVKKVNTKMEAELQDVKKVNTKMEAELQDVRKEVQDVKKLNTKMEAELQKVKAKLDDHEKKIEALSKLSKQSSLK